MEFNNGDVIDFDIIKANREIAVPQIAEGNKSLERLMNFCVDNNIRTHASCGHEEAYISFEVENNSRDILYSLARKIQSNRALYDVALVSLSINDKKIVCTFYECLNDLGITNNNFFDFILKHFMEYSFNPNLDIEEYKYAEVLLKILSNYGFDSFIEFYGIKTQSSVEKDFPQYKIKIYGNEKDYILNTIKEFFPKFIYSSENIEMLISLKYYEVMNFEDLKQSCIMISKLSSSEKTKKTL